MSLIRQLNEYCAATMDYSNEFNLKFLEIYQSEPCIWDPSHPQHKNKKHICDAWLRIRDTLGEQVDDLKRRKESLMATFRGHLRRKKASMKLGGEIYKPVWYAYEFMESFLGKVIGSSSTINTQERINATGLVGPENSQDGACVSRSASNTEPSKRVKIIRRRKNPPVLQKKSNQMKNAYNVLNHIIAEKSYENDECDLFGKMIAKKLRKMPENERDSLMYVIHGTFVNANTRNMSQFFPPPATTVSEDIISPSNSSTSVSYSHVKYITQESLDGIKQE